MASVEHDTSPPPPPQLPLHHSRALQQGSVHSGGACTAVNTKKAYKSYINGIKKWIEKNLQSPQSILDENGGINVAVFTKSHFIKFLLDKINSKSLKVSTLGGYRSAIWNI
ncbi:hypothetical protein PHMEG_00026879 [Phytophthora megakarya]|uniref:Core-binding (CB) domain-containing protein n=1 Tax=Phytophthora megakarya TaxID=4795 RepID=A0A225V8K3_9STRA|nr:hypothetical protein PHMEG_00026879 [Phytophthora megakarya]